MTQTHLTPILLEMFRICHQACWSEDQTMYLVSELFVALTVMSENSTKSKPVIMYMPALLEQCWYYLASESDFYHNMCLYAFRGVIVPFTLQVNVPLKELWLGRQNLKNAVLKAKNDDSKHQWCWEGDTYPEVIMVRTSQMKHYQILNLGSAGTMARDLQIADGNKMFKILLNRKGKRLVDEDFKGADRIKFANEVGNKSPRVFECW